MPDPEFSPVDLDYELVKMIGRGGYGEVWLVRDKTGAYRACKVVYRESFDNDRPYDREYEGICKFEPVSQASESQVKILHVGRRNAAGCFYYVMELADDVHEGQALDPERYVPKTLQSERERRGRLSAPECIDLGLSLSAALENLHSHGLIHRDIKPANIIFVNGLPKLADIGLVTDADVTVSYVGTGGFIPPEGPSSPQADVYALGKVLYEISTGKDRLDYPELPENFGDLPDRELLLELNAVVARACEADPRKRYASASALHADLALLKEGKSVRDARHAQRVRVLAGRTFAALLILAFLAVVTIYLTQHFRISSSPPPVVETTSRLPLPDAARLAEHETKIRERYHHALVSDPPNLKQRAAADLVKQSAQTEDPALQLASLRVASELAAGASDFSLAMQICETIGNHFDIRILPTKAGLLARMGGVIQTPAKCRDLAGECIKYGFEAIAEDDYPSGTILARLAQRFATNSTDSRLGSDAAFLSDEMERSSNAFEEIKPSKETLRHNSADPKANVAVGKFLCFVKNDWEGGLPLLVRGADGPFKAAVLTEANGLPGSTGAMVALAEAWRNLAGSPSSDEKVFYQRRARYWYGKALGNVRNQERQRLMEKIIPNMPPPENAPAELHIYSRFEGSEAIDIYPDEIRWKSGRVSVLSKVNQITLGDFKSGDLKIIKNCEATRFLPDSVDLTSAQKIIVQKPKRQAGAKLGIQPDHIRVTLTHQGQGQAEIEVTVKFGGAK